MTSAELPGARSTVGPDMVNSPSAAGGNARDLAVRSVHYIAVTMSGAYGVQVVVDLCRPRIDPSDRPIGVLGDAYPGITQVVFWSVVTSWAVVAGLWLAIAARFHTVSSPGWQRSARKARPVSIAVLLVPFAAYPAFLAVQHIGTLLVCLPSTGFALWGVHRMQRYRRMPSWLLLAVFGWGLLIATGFGAMMNVWFMDYAVNYALASAKDLDRAQLALNKVITFLALNAGLFEESAKAAGVVIVFLLFRRHVDGVVSGVVLGAAVGLGFNLAESVEYMSAIDGSSAEFQYFMRQSVGLMAAHTAFTAVAGAGIGAARQFQQTEARLAAVGCCLFAAISGHFATDVVMFWYSQHGSLFPAGSAVGVLVLQALILLIIESPCVAMYLMLLRGGLRRQAGGVTAEMHAETRTANGAVTDLEVPVLLSPARRLWLKLIVFRRYGVRACLSLSRLHAAQLDLATQRWHRTRGELDEDQIAAEENLRGRVRQLKSRQAALLSIAPPAPIE